MTFAEMATDEWYDNDASTSRDLVATGLNEGYTPEEIKEKVRGTKWEKSSKLAPELEVQYNALTLEQRQRLGKRQAEPRQAEAGQTPADWQGKQSAMRTQAEEQARQKRIESLMANDAGSDGEEAKRARAEKTVDMQAELEQSGGWKMPEDYDADKVAQDIREGKKSVKLTDAVPDGVKGELDKTLDGVDLSDGLSHAEAKKMADAYRKTSDTATPNMFLAYLYNTLGLDDDAVRAIVTNATDNLKEAYNKRNPDVQTVSGVTGREMRHADEAISAEEKRQKELDPYGRMTENVERAADDVAKSDTREKERNPKSVLRALTSGEFGDIGRDADPEERKRAFQTAIYLGGDIVATALKNIGATFRGGQPTGESLWKQRQRQNYEASTANTNKTLDASTTTEIGGKQKALDYDQQVRQSLNDGRISTLIAGLNEDIKADDVLRDQAKYRDVANQFKGLSLDDKANVVLGMEMDGKNLSTQALITMLASLSPQDFQDLAGKVGDLAGAIGSGAGKALSGVAKGLMGAVDGNPLAGGSVEDVEKGVQDALNGGFKSLLAPIAPAMKELDKKRLAKAAEKARARNKEIQPQVDTLNAMARESYPYIKFETDNGKIRIGNLNKEAYQYYAQKYGLPDKMTGTSIDEIKKNIVIEIYEALAEEGGEN